MSDKDLSDGADVFVEAMVTFITSFFGTLDPEFVEQKILKGSDEDFVARSLLQSVIDEVRGDKSEADAITAGDLGGILDRITWLHLGTRYPDIFGEMSQPWLVAGPKGNAS